MEPISQSICHLQAFLAFVMQHSNLLAHLYTKQKIECCQCLRGVVFVTVIFLTQLFITINLSIHNNSFSLKQTNGTNKLEYLSVTSLFSILLCNTLTYWPIRMSNRKQSVVNTVQVFTTVNFLRNLLIGLISMIVTTNFSSPVLCNTDLLQPCISYEEL